MAGDEREMRVHEMRKRVSRKIGKECRGRSITQGLRGRDGRES